jgi:hypothetical protein
LVFRPNTDCIAGWIICCPKSAPASGIAADQERGVGYDRTDSPSYLRVTVGYLPGLAFGIGRTIFPSLFETEGPNRGLSVGPFPKGMPVDLLANLELALEDASFLDRLRHDKKLLGALFMIKSAVKTTKGMDNNAALEVWLSKDVFDPLFELSKCKDYVVNRGHYFGTKFFAEELLQQNRRMTHTRSSTVAATYAGVRPLNARNSILSCSPPR